MTVAEVSNEFFLGLIQFAYPLSVLKVIEVVVGPKISNHKNTWFQTPSDFIHEIQTL